MGRGGCERLEVKREREKEKKTKDFDTSSAA